MTAKGRTKAAPWAKVRREVDPEMVAAHRERIEAEIALYDLRRRLGLTQETMGERLQIRQANVSKLERRSDPRLSTLRQYVEGMGLRLRVEAEFPDGSRVPLRLGDDGEDE